MVKDVLDVYGDFLSAETRNAEREFLELQGFLRGLTKAADLLQDAERRVETLRLAAELDDG